VGEVTTFYCPKGRNRKGLGSHGHKLRKRGRKKGGKKRPVQRLLLGVGFQVAYRIRGNILRSREWKRKRGGGQKKNEGGGSNHIITKKETIERLEINLSARDEEGGHRPSTSPSPEKG